MGIGPHILDSLALKKAGQFIFIQKKRFRQCNLAKYPHHHQPPANSPRFV